MSCSITMMQIRVVVFAQLAQALNAASFTVSLPQGSTVEKAVETLEDQHPELRPYRSGLAFAVNHAYVKAQHKLQAGDELALISPVSGG